MGAIARDVSPGTVLKRTLWLPYRCRGTLKISVGYSQERRPSQMPFMVDGRGNAKVGRAVQEVR